MNLRLIFPASAMVLAMLLTGGRPAAFAQSAAVLPTGQTITPTAAPGTVYTPLLPRLPDAPQVPAGYAVSEALSPDGNTLLVLNTGYNLVVDANGVKLPNDSTQYVFVYDVSSGPAVQKQVLQVSNSFVGIVFSPDGSNFYVPGGVEDNVHVFSQQNGVWAQNGSPIPLGHSAGIGIGQKPLASGIAVTADGTRSLVVNRFNDSVSMVDLNARAVVAELDLRPGKENAGASGVPGGEYPNSVAIVGNNLAFVSSERDREVVMLGVSGSTINVVGRVPVQGNPNKMVLNRSQTKLYVASENADLVTVIDTQTGGVVATVPTTAPGNVLAASKMKYKGSSPNGLALSPDDSRLFVANRGTNSVAVIAANQPQPSIVGLIPAGWYTSDVRVAASGGYLYVSNAKTDPGADLGNCSNRANPCPVVNSPVRFTPNDNVLSITGSVLLSIPMPDGATLSQLTQQVATNNGFATPSNDPTMAALRGLIKHVIYVIKENRTYDQVLGDVGKGNSDPALTEFPQTTTPSQHALANTFVLLDNFYDPGDVSGDGWPWSTSARESDAGAKTLPPNSAGSGGSYDWEGMNRGVNVALTGALRQSAYPLNPTDPDLLPGTGNVAAPDGPDGQIQQGYLWNAALRAGLTVRNYGFFIDLTRYSTPVTQYLIPRDRTPAADKSLQSYPANPQLFPVTDVYYRGYDAAYPDFYREREWEREFQGYVLGNSLPSLSLVRLMEDHTGSFAAAIDGVNRPDIQVADNDYAVGRLVDAVAKSHYAFDTLIFIVEDDAQDGPDHVDAHRSTAYIVGPYVKKNAVVSTHYTTVNMLRTICDILGMDHLSVYDSNAAPMSDVFDLSQRYWSFTATASSLLRANTQLPIPAGTRFSQIAPSPRSLAYWVDHSRGFDFSKEDNLDAVAYNEVLWEGLKGSRYPTHGGRAAGAPVVTKAAAGDRDD